MKVDAFHSAEVSGSLFSGWGAVSGGRSADGCIVSAVAGVEHSSGIAVVGLAAEPCQGRGAILDLPDALCFAKPRGLPFGAAAQLPFIALTASAALLQCGLEPGRASVGRGDSAPATVVVCGGSCRVSEMLVGLLAARGANTVAAVRGSSCIHYERLGALAVNHDSQAWSLHAASAIVDTLGSEDPRRLMPELGGAVYVSTAPPQLRSLNDDGVVSAARRAWAGFQEPAPCWSAAADEALVAQALGEVFSLVESGALGAPPAASGAREVGTMLAEYVDWVRDENTGLRCGFPGRNLWADPPPEPPERVLRVRRPRNGFSG